MSNGDSLILFFEAVDQLLRFPWPKSAGPFHIVFVGKSAPQGFAKRSIGQLHTRLLDEGHAQQQQHPLPVLFRFLMWVSDHHCLGAVG